jgi:pSer/pThr/pTyr-binding forkhead associated (FHA) protein
MTHPLCAACTHENRPGAFFCAQCGGKLHFASPTRARLVRMNGAFQDRRIELPSSVCVLGRDPTATVRLEEESVSKQHARLTLEDGRFTLEDLDSSNGTFVNGRRIHARVELRPGDLLRLGAVILKLEA